MFCKFALMRLLVFISLTVCCAVGLFICYTILTGRGENVSTIDTSSYTVRGADLSAHNGDVDYNALKDHGLEFVYLKATEGGDFKDKNFAKNFKEAKAAGLLTGVYHFFRFDTPGYLQALNVLHSISGREINLPVVIDVEEWGNPRGIATDKIIKEVKNMAETLRKEGYEIMLYTNKDGYNRFVKKGLKEFPLWLCSFRKINDSVEWDMWQYTHRGIIKGVERLTDLSVWKGTKEEWDNKYKISNN